MDIEVADQGTVDILYRRRQIAKNTDKAAVARLKAGIWFYFFLLLTEGALRKWVFPALATPLLIVRDPVAIWLLITAYSYGKLQFNVYEKSLFYITAIGMITALLFGHGSLVVALYGARIFFFHFPLMFLIGKIFTKEDVLKMGRVVLVIAIPMTFLIALQFNSPQSAFINRGIGGDVAGAGFAGALGFFRPPGTFSFTSGNSQFYCVTGLFIIYFWLNPANINRLILIASTVCFIAAIPLSISRTLVFQTVVSLGFAGVSILNNPKYLGRVMLASMGLFIILALLNNVAFFRTATEALTSRYDDATDNEGGLSGTLGDRFLGGLLSAVESSDQPFFGFGIGMGTNAGAKLLKGDVIFLIAEEEWGRLIGEMGTILGLSIIYIRVRVCLIMTIESYKKVRSNDLLPWMILSYGVLLVAQSQWAQPTTLGFSTLIGGLILASLEMKKAI